MKKIVCNFEPFLFNQTGYIIDSETLESVEFKYTLENIDDRIYNIIDSDPTEEYSVHLYNLSHYSNIIKNSLTKFNKNITLNIN
jgi:hypothetical protein